VNNDLILNSNEINAAVDELNGQSESIKRRRELMQGRSSKRMKTRGGGYLDTEYTNLFKEVATNPDQEIDDNSTLFWDADIVPDTGDATYFDILRLVEEDPEAKEAAGGRDATTIDGKSAGKSISTYARGMQAYEKEMLRDAPRAAHARIMYEKYGSLYSAPGQKTQGLTGPTAPTTVKKGTSFVQLMLFMLNILEKAILQSKALKHVTTRERVTIKFSGLDTTLTFDIDPNKTVAENMKRFQVMLNQETTHMLERLQNVMGAGKEAAAAMFTWFTSPDEGEGDDPKATDPEPEPTMPSEGMANDSSAEGSSMP
jgi:hypothetical protein